MVNIQPGTNYFGQYNANVNISLNDQFGYAIQADCEGNPNVFATDSGVFATGCQMTRKDIFTGNNVYFNTGTLASPVWTLQGSGGGGTPALPFTSVQFNNSGAFGGSANFLWDDTNQILSLGGLQPTIISMGGGAEFNINGGNAINSGDSGDFLLLAAGAGLDTGGGGEIHLTGGQGGDTGQGGQVNIRAGNGGATSGDAGSMIFSGGSTFGSGLPGDIRFNPGTGSGQQGKIGFVNALQGVAAFIDTSLLNSTDRTFTFPNQSGTFALTSDLGNFVPYTGATGNVNLNTQSLVFDDGSATLFISATPSSELFNITNGGATASLDISALSTARTFTFPDKDGTFAMLSDISTPSLTDTQIAFGDASNLITSSANFTWIDSTNTLNLGTNAVINASSLDILGNGGNSELFLDSTVARLSNVSKIYLFSGTNLYNFSGGSFDAILDASNMVTANRTFIFPDQPGTFVVNPPDANTNINILVQAGNAVSGNTVGGNVTLSSGSATGNADAGDIVINGGFGSGTGTGADFIANAGGGGSSGGKGGSSSFTGGNGGGGNSNGGDVLFTPGQHTGSGTDGQIKLFNATNFLAGIFNFDSLATVNRTYSYPDQDGIVYALPDPGANTIAGWDDTDNAPTNFLIGSGLTYTHSTHTLSASGGGGSPGGSDTQVQFNDAGSFGGNAGLTFNKTTQVTTALISDAGTTNQVYPFVISHTTSGTASTNFGTGIFLMAQQANGSTTELGFLRSYWSNASAPTAVMDLGVTTGGMGAAIVTISSGVFSPFSTGATTLGSTSVPWGNLFMASTAQLLWSSDLILTRKAAAKLQLGAADAASPVAQNLSVQSVVAGTSNTAGSDFNVYGSAGTGNAGGGKIIFNVGKLGTSGTAQNTYTAGVTINSGGDVVMNNDGSVSTTGLTLKSAGANFWTFGIGGSNPAITGGTNSNLIIDFIRLGHATGDVGIIRSAAGVMSINDGSTTTTNYADWIASQGTLTQAVKTSGSPTAFTVTGGAHTTLAASTEDTDINFNLNRTVQFATGALTTQRAMRIQAPTYGFVGASTITNAATLDISGAPIAGTNATITNAYAARINTGQTTAVGLRVTGQTSQTAPPIQIQSDVTTVGGGRMIGFNHTDGNEYGVIASFGGGMSLASGSVYGTLGSARFTVSNGAVLTAQISSGQFNFGSNGASYLIMDNVGNTSPIFQIPYVGINNKPGMEIQAGASQTANPFRVTDASSVVKTSISPTGLINNYASVATTGWGVPAIYASNRVNAQTASASLTAYTVGAADGSFLIAANVNITAVTVASFQVTCTYTDETNTSRTLVLNFSQINGTLVQTLTAALGTGAYEGVPLHIRAKAGTTITIASTGTFTTVTYNMEEFISQIA